ncbi:MAG: hypothetical protein HY253_06490 [Burkholderiales bacterium]|nr:hypothetical protein [Burkholderiales bacterium]
MSIEQENQENTTGEQDFTRCPEWGKGGHFIVNPATGLRERVQPFDESAPAENTQQEPETKKVASKEKNRG